MKDNSTDSPQVSIGRRRTQRTQQPNSIIEAKPLATNVPNVRLKRRRGTPLSPKAETPSEQNTHISENTNTSEKNVDSITISKTKTPNSHKEDSVSNAPTQTAKTLEPEQTDDKSTDDKDVEKPNDIEEAVQEPDIQESETKLSDVQEVKKDEDALVQEAVSEKEPEAVSLDEAKDELAQPSLMKNRRRPKRQRRSVGGGDLPDAVPYEGKSYDVQDNNADYDTTADIYEGDLDEQTSIETSETHISKTETPKTEKVKEVAPETDIVSSTPTASKSKRSAEEDSPETSLQAAKPQRGRPKKHRRHKSGALASKSASGSYTNTAPDMEQKDPDLIARENKYFIETRPTGSVGNTPITRGKDDSKEIIIEPYSSFAPVNGKYGKDTPQRTSNIRFTEEDRKNAEQAGLSWD